MAKKKKPVKKKVAKKSDKSKLPKLGTKAFEKQSSSVKKKMRKNLEQDKVKRTTGAKKKGRKRSLKNRLRHKGKLITLSLEEQIRKCYKAWKDKGKKVTYKQIIDAFFDNKNKAINDLDNYMADPFCGIDELESGIYEFHFYFMSKVKEMIELYQIKTPKFFIMNWGDDFYIELGGISELRAEIDDFVESLYKAYSEARRNGDEPPSPQWQIEMSLLIYSGEIFIDLNKTDVDDSIRYYMDNK
jgi:hypothetical protein